MTTNQPELPGSKSAFSPLLRHLRSMLIAGVITAIPLFITLVVLLFIYNQVTLFTDRPAKYLVEQLVSALVANPSKELIANWQMWAGPIIALPLSILIIYFLGLLSIFTVGRRVLHGAENFLQNLPLIKGIYGTVKQVVTVFRQGGGGSGFQRVVLVEFPRLGTWTIAFVTRTVTDSTNHTTYVCCFIPMTPNPTSGFFQLFPEGDIRETGWTVDQGLKILLSGGLLAPADLSFPPPAASTTPPGK